MEGKKVGLVYIGVAFLDGIETYELQLDGTREEIVHQAVRIGAMKILEKIREK